MIPKMEKRRVMKKMNTKMAAIFLTLTIALGTLGVVAAWWREELYINGTVTTGTFGWELTLDYWDVYDDYKGIADADVWLSDYVNGHAKSLNFEVNNMYPCIGLDIWWDLEYYGSVPGHIYDVTATATENGVPLPDFPQYVYIYVYVDSVSQNLFDQGIVTGEWNIWDFFDALKCTQWHQYDYVYVEFYWHLVEYDMVWPGVPPGTEVPMDTTIGLTVTFFGQQYNVP